MRPRAARADRRRERACRDTASLDCRTQKKRNAWLNPNASSEIQQAINAVGRVSRATIYGLPAGELTDDRDSLVVVDEVFCDDYWEN